jgi:CRP/FNR family transcriptional regulator, cyclic AMP receptor protein
MIIPFDILEKHGATFYKVEKEGFIFYEDETAHFYYQLIEGLVKMSSFSAGGQEFIQGMFHAGECFGEPALLGDFPYPSNAIAVEDSRLARLPKQAFFDILEHNFDIQQRFNLILARRLRYKSILLKEISSYSPEHIILTLLRYHREINGGGNGEYSVPFTRQQIADMCGLRVETVIRAVKKLEKEGRLIIREHKIHLP